jgi:ABC-type multidrug transport system permease subunit
MTGSATLGRGSPFTLRRLTFLVVLVLLTLGISAVAGVFLWGLVCAAIAVVISLFWWSGVFAQANR